MHRGYFPAGAHASRVRRAFVHPRSARVAMPGVRRALIMILAIAPAAQAQDDDPVACRACRIEIERVVRLGNRDGPGALAGRDLIAMDGRGRFYATSVARRGEIAIFGPDGRFLRLLGRTGKGPGEFSMPHPITFGTADTMIVFDPSNYRISTLSPSYEPVATVPITGYARDALRRDGRVGAPRDRAHTDACRAAHARRRSRDRRVRAVLWQRRARAESRSPVRGRTARVASRGQYALGHLPQSVPLRALECQW